MKRLAFALAAVGVAGLGVACSNLLGLHDFALDPEYGADANAPDAGGVDSAGRESGVDSGGPDTAIPDGSQADGPCGAGINTSTDPQNCGACGHDCLGGGCVAGACEPVKVAAGFVKPFRLAVDATNLYWVDTDLDNGGVYRCPKANCVYNEITSDSVPDGLTVDALGLGIYWGHAAFPGEIDMAAPDGGVFPVILGADLPDYLVTDTNGIYWVNTDTAPNGSVAFSPRSGSQDGGTILASGYGTPDGLALSGGVLYWTAQDDGTLHSCSVPGCSPVTNYSVGGSPKAIVVDGTTMYWADQVLVTGEVLAAPAADAAAPLVLGQGQNNPLAVRFDATDVYWVNGGDPGSTDGSLMRCSKTGCAASPTTLLSGLAFPTDLVLDGPWIYFVTEGDGTVWKVAK